MRIHTRPLLLAVTITTLLSQPTFAFTQNVAAGTTVEGETIDSTGYNNEQSVYGTANNTTIMADNYQEIESGGVANATTVDANGGLVVKTGGISNNAAVNADGLLTLGSGATANDSVVYGNLQNEGGTDVNTVLKSGSVYNMLGSATAAGSQSRSIGTIMETGSHADISGNAEADNWQIAGEVDVHSNSSNEVDPLFNDTVVNNGGVVNLDGSAEMDNTTVNTGGRIYVTSTNSRLYSTVNNTTINGGTVDVDMNGIANDTVINAGTLSIDAGGVSNNATINGGLMVNNDGDDIGTQVNGGRYDLNGAATAENLTINADAYARIDAGTVTGATIGGTMSVASATLQGNVTVNEGGTLNLDAEANTSGADISDSGNVYLADNSDYILNTLTMKEGDIYFSPPQTGYSDLTVDSLSGTGTFYMNTSIGEQQGDFLNVTGEANGDFDVYVNDTGVSPTSDASLQIIQTGGGNAEFDLANTGGVVDVGTYEYQLVADGKGGWALTPEAPPEPTPPTPNITPSTAAVLNMATVDPLIFQAEINTVRSRLDEVRSFSHDTNVWGHYTTQRNNVNDSASAGFDINVNGVTFGADRSIRKGHGTTTQGAFFTYSHSDVNFDRQGDGNVDSYSLGAYASFQHDNGFYLDGILKANRFENDVNGRMSSGGATDGYYDTNGLGANLQAGQYFHLGQTYIAPYIGLTGFTTDSSTYRLSNGMQAHVGNERSVLGETGVNIGHRFTLKNGAAIQPYARLAVTQEFIDDNHVDVNDDGHFNNDLSGTRGVYQLGVNTQLTRRMNLHVDASYAQGANNESPWAATLGASYSF